MFRVCAVASGFALLLTGCSETGLNHINDGTGAYGPQINVEPLQLDFGSLDENESSVMTFEIQSVGRQALEISKLELQSETGAFTILTEDWETLMEPDATQEIEVSFTPVTAEDFAKVRISSDDIANPKVDVELFGYGKVPGLAISPTPYDMGSTYVGCPNPGEVTLTNVGTGLLVVDDVSIAGDSSFVFTNPNTMPLELNEGEEAVVYVDFDPESNLDYNGVVSASSNDPYGVRQSDLMGTGMFAANYTDEWELDHDPLSDIIFSVDQSCSMDDDQARLASNFNYFINELSNYTNDWQIIVANDDDGCASQVLDPTVSGYQSAFSSQVSRGGGSYTESLLTVTSNAVEKAVNGQCNHGFLRNDAMLHIIMVSDEPEQSARTWDFYVNKVIGLKGDASLVKMSAIVGDYPGGCSTADAGTGYYEAANYTNGEFLSICATSWASYMTALAEASVNQSAFSLSATPVESTIVVAVNGQNRTSGWYYEASANSVIITENVPEGGDEVIIDYAGAANCD